MGWLHKMLGISSPSAGPSEPSNPSNDDALSRAAWEKREEKQWPTIKSYGPFPVTDEYIQQQRWENSKLHATLYPQLDQIVSVRVDKTGDTGNPVFGLEFIDGRSVTLWCEVGGSVRSISASTDMQSQRARDANAK